MIKNYDLSVLITARNEEWLARTVRDVIEKRRGNTQIIVIADGYWPNPPVMDHPDILFVHHEKSVGQRAGINDAARLSKAKFVMKLDAHCVLDEGFDVKLMEHCEYNWIVVPAMYNLHAFNWRCKKCGNEWYQGPSPERCYHSGESRSPNEACNNTTEFERVIVWEPRKHRRSEHYRFDSDLHFQYWGSFKDRPESEGVMSPTMSLNGACWFLHREFYWELGGLDEEHGSWGQMGTEIACKAWLSGGKLYTNKNTWFAHLFRTQGGDFTFPYPQSANQMQHARNYSNRVWKKNQWSKAKHSLRWMLEWFEPVPGWDVEQIKALEYLPNENIYESPFDSGNVNKTPVPVDNVNPNVNKPIANVTKGIIYYTDNQLNLKIAHLCKNQIKSIGFPIVSTSLKPLTDMGKNFHVKMERGYLAYFTQILTALENLDTDIVYFCEHDVLYHESHFDFTPPEKDKYYYNFNFWRLRSSDGHAIHYDTHQVNLICGYRETLLIHYKKRLQMLNDKSDRYHFASEFLDEEVDEEKAKKDLGNFVRRMGFEPGTHNRAERVDDLKAERFDSAFPCIDIRHGSNLTASRWSKDQFRDQRNCKNWQETDDIPGWGKWDPEKLRF